MTVTRRAFLRMTACGLGLGACRRGFGAAGNRRPNIVYVFADQMRSHVLGCYGGTAVKTPRFDRLAADGAVFENAISTWPVCSPHRAMLMTGLYPLRNHTVANDTAVRRDVPTIASVCKKAGYRTGYVGKWHLENKRDPFVPPHRRLGFEDFWASDNCRHRYFDGYYCGDTPEKVKLPGYKPEHQVRMAVDFINRYKAEEFCLFLSWGPPHDPYRGPEEEMALFPPEEIALRRNVAERKVVDRLLETDPTRMGERVRRKRANRRKIIDSDRLLRERYIRGYYALTKTLDDLMGRLLDAIAAAGIAEDTIVVFSSDHGDMLGSHRMASKQMPHEESISIPFILRYPRKIPAGSRTDVLLTPVDIMPTLLSLAGIDCPDVDGVDLSGAAGGEDRTGRDAVLIMKLVHGGNPWLLNGVTPWRGVRTKRYTYARLNDRGPWVLFDNQKDPCQLENLINNPACADLRARLDRRTDELLAEAGDPDDTAAVEALRRQVRGGG